MVQNKQKINRPIIVKLSTVFDNNNSIYYFGTDSLINTTTIIKDLQKENKHILRTK